MPNSFAQTAELTCSQCRQPFSADVWLIVDVAERLDLLERIGAGTLYDLFCPHCGHASAMDAPLLVYIPDSMRTPHKPPLLFSPAQRTTAEEDRQQLDGLLAVLYKKLGNSLRDEWLQQIALIRRELLPTALNDDPQAVSRQMAANMRSHSWVDPDALRQTIIKFLRAENSTTSQSILEAHPELLDEEADSFLSQLIDTLDDERIRRHFVARRAVLRRCREIGIAQAFAEKANANRQSAEFGYIPPAFVPILDELAQPASASATVTRYTDIACPRRVWVETPRITVVVRLTVQEPEYSAAVEKLMLQAGVPVRVRITAPAFKVIGGDERELLVPLGQNSETSFDLKPLLVGHTRISFDFFQAGNPVGTASVTLEITEQEVSAAAERRKSQILRFEPGAPPPDLMLYVAYERIAGQPHLIFTLYQDRDEHGITFAPRLIRGEPQYYAEGLYETLTHWTRQIGSEHLHLSASEVNTEIMEIGQNLWDELIPGDLQTLYSEKRQEWQGKRLLLISDDPYIPWELVWPYSFQQAEQSDREPWGITLKLTRWLRRDAQGRGYAGPPATLRIGKLACIAPADIDLPFVAQECAFLAGLVQQYKLADHSPPSCSRAQVLRLLTSGDYHWLHIATHGELEVGPLGQSARIQLEGRESLTPSKIVGPQIKGHIWRERPAFVFNTCHGARQSWALARLEGWADRLVGAGAGLFVAPLWTVNDERSFQFTQKFYAALLEGQTVADAVHAGRQAAYRDGDPTWLAYSVYAHPNARVQWMHPA